MRQLGLPALERAKAIPGRPLICSTVGEIALPHHGHAIQINRLVDFHGNILGLGPRLGHTGLQVQLQIIVEAAEGNPLVIAKDGIFSGRTIVFW